MNMSLLVVGSMAFDAIETPFGSTDKIIGGAASYICLSSSVLHSDINLVAVVGGDFPTEFVDTLRQRGVRTEGLQVMQDRKSFFWKGRYHLDMNTRDTLATELNVLGDFDPIIPDSYQDSRYVMLGNLSPKVQSTVIERLKNKPELVVMDTMNFWMETAMDDLRHTLTLADVLTINDEEARQLSGEYSLVKAARKIRAMGPKTLVIKKGEHGALLFHEDEIFFCPALPLEDVFDPTGAGDTFAGGFIGYLASQGRKDFDAFRQAIVHGSALASFCVEKFGTERIAEISAEDLQQRIRLFQQLSSF